jgi:hypothetical protein
LFDRQLKRFFESLDQWDSVLPQALLVVQMSVAISSIRYSYHMLTRTQCAIESDLNTHVVVDKPITLHPTYSSNRSADLDRTSLRHTKSNSSFHTDSVDFDTNFIPE